MLAMADGARAATLRDEFAAVITEDWRKVLAFAQREQLMSPVDVQLISQALDELRAAGVPPRSEFFHFYFLALESLNRRDRTAATAAITSLGNVILEDAAGGTVTVPLPVACSQGAAVDVPAASPGYRLSSQAENGLLHPGVVEACASEIRRAISATWITRAPEGLGIRGATGPVEFEITKYDERTSALAGAPSYLRVLEQNAESGDTSTIVQGLQSAMTFLDAMAPQQAEEVRTLTEYVVPLRGRQFVGGSDIFLYGASFLRLRPEWSFLCYADHLVHEAAHQLLHAAQELRPLLLNRDHVGAPSPIRSDPRPLYGSFHATFVFLRLAQMMRVVLMSPLTEWHEEALMRFHRHLLGLLQGLAILAEHGDFSDAGRAELDAWIESARDLKGLQGLPDQRLYLRVDWDYEPANSGLPLFKL